MIRTKDAPVEKDGVQTRALEVLLPHGAASLELIGALIERVNGEKDALSALMLAHANVVDVACVAVPSVLERISQLIKLCLVDLNTTYHTSFPSELEFDLASTLRHCERYDLPDLQEKVLELTRNLFPMNPNLVPGCSLPKTKEQAELDELLAAQVPAAPVQPKPKKVAPSKKGGPVSSSKTKSRK